LENKKKQHLNMRHTLPPRLTPTPTPLLPPRTPMHTLPPRLPTTPASTTCILALHTPTTASRFHIPTSQRTRTPSPRIPPLAPTQPLALPPKTMTPPPAAAKTTRTLHTPRAAPRKRRIRIQPLNRGAAALAHVPAIRTPRGARHAHIAETAIRAGSPAVASRAVAAGLA
jgi:hypothetical protein